MLNRSGFTLGRTKSSEGRTADLPFDHEGKVSDRAFNPYHKSLGKAKQEEVRHASVLVTMLHDLNPDPGSNL